MCFFVTDIISRGVPHGNGTSPTIMLLLPLTLPTSVISQMTLKKEPRYLANNVDALVSILLLAGFGLDFCSGP